MVQKRGERLVVTRRTETLLDIPVFQVENLIIIGNVQLTTQVLHMLMESGVDVSYFTYSGKYLGRVAAESSKNIFLRFEQYALFTDEERRLDMARIVVRNKIDNQIYLLEELAKRNTAANVRGDIAQMRKNMEKVDRVRTTNGLMGVEGICSNIYFGAFGKMLKCDFTFEGRNRRPPRDPVNVMLSLTYTFLTKSVSQALDAESFETYLGFLHGIRYGRKSLALDMVEEFRQPCGDRFVLLILNKKMIGLHDFDFPEDGSVVLNEDGFQKFCREYERWMNGRNTVSGEQSFQKRIREQASKLKKSIVNKAPYEPYNWRQRHVSGEL